MLAVGDRGWQAGMAGTSWATISVRVPRSACRGCRAFCDPRIHLGRDEGNGVRDIDATLRQLDIPKGFVITDLLALNDEEQQPSDLEIAVSHGHLTAIAMNASLLTADVVGNLLGTRGAGSENVYNFAHRALEIGGADNTPSVHNYPLDFLVRRRDDEQRSDPSGVALSEISVVVLRILGSRRWDIFTPDLAGRSYHIAMPAGLLKRDDGVTVVGVPLLTLTRRQGARCFKRNVGVSLIMLPCSDESGLRSVNPNCDDWRALIANPDAPPSSLGLQGAPEFKLLDGTLRRLVSAFDWSKEESLTDARPLSLWVRTLARTGVSLLLGSDLSSTAAVDVTHHIWAGTALGVKRGAILRVPDLSSTETHAWLNQVASRSGQVGDSLQCQRVTDAVLRLVESVTNTVDGGARQPVDVASWQRVTETVLGILGSLGFTDDGGIGQSLIVTPYAQAGRQVICHFPDQACSIALIPGHRAGPEPPLLRMLGPMLSMSLGLATVRSMIYHFHHEVSDEVSETARRQRSERTRSRDLSGLLLEFVVDLDETYDLDLKAPWYKYAYERVKELSGVDNDFVHVKASVETLMEQVTAGVFQRSTDATLAFTLTIAIATIALVLINVQQHLWAEGAAGVAVLIAGWGLFRWYMPPLGRQ